MNFLRRLGQEKYKFIRIFSYIQIVNLAILIDVNGFRWWYLMCIPLVILVYLFEGKFGIPGELDVAWKSSKEWQAFKQDFYSLRDYLYKK